MRRVKYQTAGSTNRYEIYPHSAYIVAARLVPIAAVTKMGALLYTSEAPEQDGDTIGKLPLAIDANGAHDNWVMDGAGILCMKGIYAYIEGTTNNDEAYLFVRFVDRRHFCPAFPRVEGGLVECWDEARNEGKTTEDPEYDPYLTDFTVFIRENPEEPVEEPSGGDAVVGEPIA